MKNDNEISEQILVIDLHITRGLAVVLVVICLAVTSLGYFAWNYKDAAASNPQTPSAPSNATRQFYLTKDTYSAVDAIDACASGYHFASLWEILDPSNLKYNSVHGLILDDSGSGPPSTHSGWVRTGYGKNSSGQVGLVNCDAWTSDSSSDDGSTAALVDDWTADYEDLNVWQLSSANCSFDEYIYVWCVED